MAWPYESLFEHLGVGLGAVPDAEKSDALCAAAERFCRETELFQADEAVTCVAGQSEYALAGVDDALLARVAAVVDANADRVPEQYWGHEALADGDVLRLATAAVVEGVEYTARLVLVPSAAEEVPARFLARYAREIALGARAGLRMQDGPAWSQPELGVFLERRFLDRCHELRGRAWAGLRGTDRGIVL